MSLYKCDGYTLDTNDSSKAIVYFKDKLLFMGDSRTAIKFFCQNCSNEKLRTKLKKYKYIKIWD
jgi:hypothetical protein